MKKRFYSLLCLVGLLSPIATSAQCFVGGTDFDTETKLCNPSLTKDADGWYDSDLDLSKICKGKAYASNAELSDMFIPSNRISASGSNDISLVPNTLVKKALQLEDYAGVSAVVANPKVFSPFCKEIQSADNMFVNVGTKENFPVLSYSVSGLIPNSVVELSFTLYNLLDADYFDYLYSNNENILDHISNYIYSANNGTITGNALKFAVVSSDDNINEESYFGALYIKNAKSMTSSTVDFGDSLRITHKAIVPADGNITFYLLRTSDAYQIPIGIDDIRIDGTILPTISYSGRACPEQPVRIATGEKYPEGTKYIWSEKRTGQTSTDKTFYFTPEEAERDYTISCAVTIPGCKESKASADLYSYTCCMSAEGAPMSITYLYYDDFGTFVNDNTYQWRDKYGVVHTETIPLNQKHEAQSVNERIPYVRAYNLEKSSARLAVPFAGDEKEKSELYNHGVYVVSKHGGYPMGVTNDNSGTTNGGMLQFDILDDGSQDDFFEMDIPNIPTGKEIAYGLDFASISQHPSGIEVSLLYNGTVLSKEYAEIKDGSEGWKSIEKAFTLSSSDIGGKSEATLTMKIKHIPVESSHSMGDGDIAIDNVFFGICTPPIVELKASTNNGTDLDNLCTDDVVVLNALISDAAKKYFIGFTPSYKLGYIYQYTYDDPTDDNAEWKTIHTREVLDKDTFKMKVGEYWDDIFSHLVFDNFNGSVSFRVVVGEYSDLLTDNSWKEQTAFTPFRRVSFSTYPVSVRLNCPVCNKPKEIKLTVEEIGDIQSYSKFSLCPGDKIKITATAIPTDITDLSFNGYDFKWDVNGNPFIGATDNITVVNDGSYKNDTAFVFSVTASTAEGGAFCSSTGETFISFLSKPTAYLEPIDTLCMSDVDEFRYLYTCCPSLMKISKLVLRRRCVATLLSIPPNFSRR